MAERQRVLEIKTIRTQPELHKWLVIHPMILGASVAILAYSAINPALFTGEYEPLLIFPIFGLVLFFTDGLATIREFILARRLDEEGVLKSVKIDRKFSTRDNSRPPQNRSLKLGNFLEYKLADGSPIRLSVGWRMYQNAVENQTISVRYLVSTPSVQRVEEKG